MSKKVKNLITQQLQARFEGVESVGVLNPRGFSAIKTNQFRRKLHENKLRMTVVRNTLARRAVDATEGSRLKGFDRLLEGPSAVVYGEASISALARLMLDEQKETATLELRGIFFDGEIYEGQDGVEQVSKMPTREEAIANILSAILGPGRTLAAALKGPGGTIGGILKTIEDKAKERGDAAPAADAAPAPDAAPAGDAAPAAEGAPAT